MTNILLGVAIALMAICVMLLVVVLRKLKQAPESGKAVDVSPRLDAMEKSLGRTEALVRDDITRTRVELLAAANQQRQELNQGLQDSFRDFRGSVVQRLLEAGSAQKDQFGVLSQQFDTFATASREQWNGLRGDITAGDKQLRGEVGDTLKNILDTTTTTLKDQATAQAERLNAFSGEIKELTRTNSEKLENIRKTVDDKLQNIQTDNTAKLEQMRATVEEKLQSTLESRLGESFKLVSERLEQVHNGLGKMQELAHGVGDLKKVFSNVKTRGIWGEIQLGVLLEQILAPDQYSQNVATKKGNERVEFAIRFPGREDAGKPVWLPIDAKCPIEDYQRLVEAQELGDKAAADESAKQLEIRLKGCGRDIRDKYISPPSTTEYAIMYLPTEGLFAEAIRRPGLVEYLQRECQVNICGPTTLAALLNSFRMGFSSWAVQKNTGKVRDTLVAAKKEFGNFGNVLDKVQKKLGEASKTIDNASVRTRAIERSLRNVEKLSGVTTILKPLPEADGTAEEPQASSQQPVASSQ